MNEFGIKTQPLAPLLGDLMSKPITTSEVFSPHGCDIKKLVRYFDQHPEESDDLIEGLIGPDMTVVWGDPKAGKTIFTLQAAYAIAVGHGDLWGLSIPSTEMKVALVTTDPLAHMEAANVIRSIGVDRLSDDRLRHWHAPVGVGLSDWQDLAASVGTWGAAVVLVDNLLGFGGVEDFSSNSAAAAVVACLKQFTSQGVRVVAVSHSRKSGFKSSASLLGSVSFMAVFRRSLHVQARAGGRVIVRVTGNSVADREFELFRDEATGLLSPNGGKIELGAPQGRDRKAIARKEHEMAYKILEQRFTQTEAGDFLSRKKQAKSPKAGEQQVKRTYIASGLLSMVGRGQPLVAGPNLPSRSEAFGSGS